MLKTFIYSQHILLNDIYWYKNWLYEGFTLFCLPSMQFAFLIYIWWHASCMWLCIAAATLQGYEAQLCLCVHRFNNALKAQLKCYSFNPEPCIWTASHDWHNTRRNCCIQTFSSNLIKTFNILSRCVKTGKSRAQVLKRKPHTVSDSLIFIQGSGAAFQTLSFYYLPSTHIHTHTYFDY